MKLCEIDGCGREVNKGLSICSTHYQRRRRGSKKTDADPVQDYGVGHVKIGTIRAPAVVANLLQETARAREISVYALCCEIVKEALDRASAGGSLFESNPALYDRSNLVELTHVALPDEYALRAHREAEQRGWTPSSMMNLLVEAWYASRTPFQPFGRSP